MLAVASAMALKELQLAWRLTHIDPGLQSTTSGRSASQTQNNWGVFAQKMLHFTKTVCWTETLYDIRII
jgi:hypothetical protein